MTRRFIWALAAFLALGCKDTTAPTLTGTWSGHWLSTFSGPGVMTFSLVENAGSLSGTWSADYTNGSSQSGSINGSLSGDGITALLTPGVLSECPYKAAGTRKNDNSIGGTFAAINCSVSVSGTFSLQREQ